MIPERLDDLTPTARAQIGEQVLDLVALALAAERGEDRPALSSARAIALLRLRTAVERHLSDPGLDPATAAAAGGHQRALCQRAARRGRSVDRAADRSAAPRALPSRVVRRRAQAHRVDRRHRVSPGASPTCRTSRAASRASSAARRATIANSSARDAHEAHLCISQNLRQLRGFSLNAAPYQSVCGGSGDRKGRGAVLPRG